MDHTEERIGNYRIVARIGRGGMGDVFEAEDETLRRRVALKTIRAQHRPSPREKSRFLREARILSQLDHPGICRIYNYLDGDDRDHLVLELIKGDTLSDWEAGSRDKLDVIEQILQVMVVAHDANIVHRDMKPDNVMVTADGTVKVLDFGLARQVVRHEPHSDTVTLAGDAVDEKTPLLDMTYTQDRGVLGTPSFMSPEQASGEPATAASDMYSCGLVMQFLLTGESAYAQSRHLPELLARVRDAETLPVKSGDADLVDLIRRLTSRAPGVRPTASEALQKVRWIRRKPARRNRRLLVALVLVLAVGGSLKYTVDLRAERQEAQMHRAQAEDLLGFMLGDLRVKLDAVGRLDIMDVVGSKAMDYFSGRDPAGLSDEDADRYVRTLNLIGQIRISEGRLDIAQVSFAQALVTAEDLVARDPDNGEWQMQLGATQFYLGHVAYNQDDLDRAEVHFREYHTISQGLVVQDADNSIWQQELAYAQNTLATLFQEQGKYAEALVVLMQAIPSKEELVRQDPKDMDLLISLANSQATYGTLMVDTGRLRDGLRYLSQGRKNIEFAVGQDSLNAQYKSILSILYQREGRVLQDIGLDGEARFLFEEDLKLSRWLVGLDPTNVEWRLALAQSLNTLGVFEVEHENTTLARTFRTEFDSLLADLDSSTTTEKLRLRSGLIQAEMALSAKDHERALQALDEVSLLLFKNDTGDLQYPSAYPGYLMVKGQVLAAGGRDREAAVAWERGVDFLAQMDTPETGVRQQDINVRLLTFVGKNEEALIAAQALQQAGYARRNFTEFCQQNELPNNGNGE